MRREDINFAPLLKAQSRLKFALQTASNDLERTGALQCFECCYELAWKTMRRMLLAKGTEVNSPHSVFREAALEKWIEDSEVWFDFLRKRALTLQAYDDDVLKDIYEHLPHFKGEFGKFIELASQFCFASFLSLQMSLRHLNIVKSILARYPYPFYAFGSRAKGTARRLSDLDLCYKDVISDSLIARLEEDFEESDLPFKVDIVSWDRCAADFQKSIEKDLVELK